MAFDKFKKFINEDFEQKEINASKEEYYDVSMDAFKQMNAAGGKMVLLEPRAYSEAQQICDYLRSRNSVVVKLSRVTPDQAKRIVDFLAGATYALKGTLQKLGNGIFLCTPNNVVIDGKMTDDEKAKDTSKKSDKNLEW